jgi:hypothetical protein
MRRPPFRLLAIACVWVTLSACQRGPQQGEVFGTVTAGGKPLVAGMVVFSDASRGIHISAPIQPDGRFVLHTAWGAGLPLGGYRVSVSGPMGQPAMPGAPPSPPLPRVAIPAKYLRPETSGLSLTVAEGDNPFDIAME